MGSQKSGLPGPDSAGSRSASNVLLGENRSFLCALKVWLVNDRMSDGLPAGVIKWPWVKTYDAIFEWMNIRLHPFTIIWMFTGCQGFDPLPNTW